MRMKVRRKFRVPTNGIPLKAFEHMTMGEIKKLDKDYKRLINGGKR